MSTNRGISKFDPATERFSNYGLTEGAQALEFNSHSFFQSPSGTIYFGGVKGFNYFNPSEIEKFDFEPQVQLLNVSVNGSPVSLDQFLQQNQLVKFRSNENNISIEFAAIDFNRNDNINYLYKLRNKDVWTSIGNQRTLNFANLSPGNYYLEVKAQYSYNTVSPHILKFAFTVLPPFYKTSWFIVIICILVILISYGIYKYRINQILKLQAIRNNIARDLHDEVGATLSGVALFSEMARQKMESHNEHDALFYLENITVNSKEMVEKMSDIVWTINPQNDSFDRIIAKLQSYAVNFCAGKNIKLHLDIDDSVRNYSPDMQVRKNFYLIIKEAINNAVKYSDGKNIYVSLNYQDNGITAEVKDDGKGFDTGVTKEGNGLNNMKARANELNAKLNIESQKERGTSVNLQMRFHPSGGHRKV